METNGTLRFGWLFKMAWRDSRRNRSRLFLFISSIILGIAALVAIYSFGNNLESDINSQAGMLLGADLVVSSNKKVSDKFEPVLDSIGDDRSREVTFASMILFPKSKGTRLVQIRALEGNYPYYGTIESSPKAAGRNFQKEQKAIVDKTLMFQFGANVGDSIKVGEITFAIGGILQKAPGQTGVSSTVAPIVYIPFSSLEKSGLLKKGSRVSYKFYFHFKNRSSWRYAESN